MIKMSQKDGIVHLWDLPEDRVCVRLDDRTQKQMISCALKIISGRYNLAKKLSVNPTTIYDFERCRFQSVSLKFLKKLSKFLNENGYEKYSLENLETKLESIKTKWVGKNIFKPKFPVNFNCMEGARIVAAILFDGGITKDLRPFYTNNEEYLTKKIIKDIETVIGKIKFYKRLNKNTWQVEFPQILGYILVNGLNLIPGKKTFTNPSVSEFIMRNPMLYVPFLQQAFDDEATVNIGLPNGGSKAVQLQQYNTQNEAPVRLIQLKELVEKFKVNASGPYGPTQVWKTKKGYTSYGFMIQITNQSDIQKFSEVIGFSLPRKQEELNQLLNSYKLKPRFKKGIIQEEIIKACKELKEENRKIIIKNIANKLKRRRSYISELMCRMVEQGRLKVIKENRGRLEKEFELIE
jgi:hypothetical protein